MGQTHAAPRQPTKGVMIRPLKNENYNRIVYPPYKTQNEQLRYMKKTLLRQYDEPVRINGVGIDYYLPKGTKLYHGSLDFYLTFDPSCMTCASNRLTFFGLDITISLWYLYELNLRQDKQFGVIYEFDVVEDIPVYDLEDIEEQHPFDVKQCSVKGVACIHPQYAYHGQPGDYGELSMELTMNLSDERLRRSIRRSIHPVQEIPITYVVNLKRLEEMAKYGKLTVHNFNPIRPNATKLPPSIQQDIQGDLKSAIEGLLRPLPPPAETAEVNEKVEKNEKTGGRRRGRGGRTARRARMKRSMKRQLRL